VALIGIGLDAVEIGRFRQVLARRPNLSARLFTAAELAYGQRGADPASRLAARFAVKEAAMKALGVGLGAFAFHDVEVVGEPGGAPSLRVTGRAAALALGKGVGGWQVSITHTEDLAMAVVTVE
jgi:holo-[acyl-carrier protein] synthase